MHPTILFDMDGVIVRSEQLWDAYEPDYLRSILYSKISSEIIGKTRGCSVHMIYEWAQRLGYLDTYQTFYQGYDLLAQRIYTEAPITIGLDDLFGSLLQKQIKLGLVSSSPMDWIIRVVERLNNKTAFTFIESVNAHPNLKPKPAPDGYIAAMKALHAEPSHTLIIEDSQTGINSAIASGAHVCCFAIHNDSDKLPHGTDTVAHTIEELSNICNEFIMH